MSETTYYQRNREVILNRAKDYYENNKELLRERAKNKYRELSDPLTAHKIDILIKQLLCQFEGLLVF